MAFTRSGVRLPLAPPYKYLEIKDLSNRDFRVDWHEDIREAQGKHITQFRAIAAVTQ
jgi:hypothetical protein